MQIGKYTVLEKLGHGASAKVYRAHDPLLDRFVALKVIDQPIDTNQEVFRRFQREAQSIAKLKHPNIVTVLDLGEDEGRVFLVLELLEGTNLSEIIASRADLSLDRKLQLLERLCGAVGFIHSQGLVHRDLKPANIHIQPNGQPKIMDFGVVRLASSSLTLSGNLKGTPYYMSPEQIQGLDVDSRSDVFSLGIICYELLSCRRPFQADSFLALMSEIVYGAYEPLGKLVPTLPAPIGQIVDKALSKLPAERYRDGNEILEALRALGTDLDAKPPILAAVTPGLPTEDAAAGDKEAGIEKALVEGGRPPPPGAHEPLPRVSLTGNLTTLAMPELLQWCAENGKSGTLRIRRGIVEKKLFFANGELLSVVSSSPNELLGQFLVRCGRVTEEQLAKVLIRQDRTHEPLGRIVIDQELLGETALQKLIQLAQEERVYDCFLWTDGRFVFEEDPDPRMESVVPGLDIGGIIEKGRIHAENWEEIRRLIPSPSTTFAVAPSGVEGETGLTEQDRRILHLIRSGKSVGEISLEMHANEFYIGSHLLNLHHKELIRIAEEPLEAQHERELKHLGDRLSEGLLHYTEGKHTEALDAFETMFRGGPRSTAARFLHEIARSIKDVKSPEPIPLDEIPILKVSLEELVERKLGPHEGFILSRVNGQWDVRSIIKICPLSEREITLAFRRFLDEDIIEWRRSEPPSSG